jgi:hypothetical protein
MVPEGLSIPSYLFAVLQQRHANQLHGGILAFIRYISRRD